ncbi:sugar-binding domain-containing protein [Luteolibacter marinus]|uniref:sugar-binding domain-containing protein n=1 Tax=Luteolibacter marinus TaxID=2776705 RepID=UPI0018671304|nr:sugar-binding domain-containing protein [Luteolibacter marinus]
MAIPPSENSSSLAGTTAKPISKDEEEAILLATRRHYFIADEATGRLLKVRDQMELLALLGKDKCLEKYRCGEKKRLRFFDKSLGKIVTLNKGSIRQLITQALERHPVNLTIEDEISRSRFEEGCRLIKEIYRLKELRVASRFSRLSEGHMPTIGREAARFFHQLLGSQGSSRRIAIGGGRTLRDMTIALDCGESSATFAATNYATRIPEGEIFDSSYLAMKVHWLFEGSRAEVVSIPPLPGGGVAGVGEAEAARNREESAIWHSDLYRRNPDIEALFKKSTESDVVFLGAGEFDRDSPSIKRVYQHLGITYEKLQRIQPPPAGDINLSFFDDNGNDITRKILANAIPADRPGWDPAAKSFFGDDEMCHPFLIGMSIACLQKMVREDKTVVLVAGGDGKGETIRAALKTGAVNALVTDMTTFNFLADPLRSKNRR